MAPVRLKYVVSFSSQDDYHKIQNILTGDGFRKWLSHPKEKSGQIDAIFQLEEPCQLSYIDIGSYYCASVEIKVGRSDWPQNTLYRTLVAASALMTPEESKLSKGIVKTRMFNTENFVADVADEKWDRIQVILRQPYRKDVQYGLSFIRLKTARDKQGVDSSTKVKDTSSSGSPALKSVSSIQKHFFGNKTKSSPISPDPVKSKLMKLAGSAENGSEQGGVLSRTAKLVLSASETAGKYSPQSRAGPSKSAKMSLFSEHLTQKYGSSLEEDVDEFLATLTKDDIDLDKVTMADLRHKFEKVKLRKLTVDEKKLFMEKCSDFICRLFDPETEHTEARTSPKSYKKSNPKIHTTPTSCKRKFEDVEVRTPNISVERTPKSNVTTNKTVKNANSRNNSDSTTLAPQRAFISEVESALKQGGADRRVPFTSRSPNINNVTPKSTKKGKSSTRKDSPAERIETCGRWLSSHQGPEADDAVEKTPESVKLCNAPNSARGRGRRKRGGRTDSSDKRKDETSTSRNYVYCSSCKGNVPEHIFSDHFICCSGTDPGKHVNRSSDTSNALTTSVAMPSSVHSPINISGDSDVIAEDSFNLVECPLCGEFYPSDVITVHADVCASAMEMSML